MSSTNVQLALFAAGAYALYRFKQTQDGQSADAVAEKFDASVAAEPVPQPAAAPEHESLLAQLPQYADDLEFSKNHPVTSDTNGAMLRFGSRIGVLSPVMRNTNLTLRAEPKIPHIPNLTWFNKSTQQHQNTNGLGRIQDPYA